jgi:dihydrofolate reductase
MSKTFNGILAMDEARNIGFKNHLPWGKEYSDLKFFKETTWKGNVIFGAKTFASLKSGGLPNRTLYVLTHFNPYGYNRSECNFVAGRSCITIINSLDDLPDGDFWICGGLSIYNLFRPKMSELYISTIKGVFEGDTVLPVGFEDGFDKKELIKENDKFKIVRMWR